MEWKPTPLSKILEFTLRDEELSLLIQHEGVCHRRTFSISEKIIEKIYDEVEWRFV